MFAPLAFDPSHLDIFTDIAEDLLANIPKRQRALAWKSILNALDIWKSKYGQDPRKIKRGLLEMSINVDFDTAPPHLCAGPETNCRLDLGLKLHFDGDSGFQKIVEQVGLIEVLALLVIHEEKEYHNVSSFLVVGRFLYAATKEKRAVSATGLTNLREGFFRQRQAEISKKKWNEQKKYAVSFAESKWSHEPTMLIGRMAELIESELVSQKMRCPKADSIRNWLKAADRNGVLHIPDSARRPGRPKS